MRGFSSHIVVYICDHLELFLVGSYDPLHTSLPGLEGALKPFYERVFIIHFM
jgi:hypothetical protein